MRGSRGGGDDTDVTDKTHLDSLKDLVKDVARTVVVIAAGEHPLEDAVVVVFDVLLTVVKVVAAARLDQLDDVVGEGVDDEGDERVVEFGDLLERRGE